MRKDRSFIGLITVWVAACAEAPATMPAGAAPAITTAATTTAATTNPAVISQATAASFSGGDPVEGKRIASHVGCLGCHGSDGRGGGFNIKTPEGDHLVAPNLTERRARYDDAGLVRLLREGKTHDGHLPIGMPIFMFQHLSDRELRDLLAWLRGLPAVANPDLPVSQLAPASLKQIADGSYPFTIDTQPDPGNTPPAERPSEPLALGRHIALSSCGECHGRTLEGWEGDSVPSLVAVSQAYNAEQFAHLMKTGIAVTGRDTATGFMSKVARSRFAVFSDAEIAAIKLYLDARWRDGASGTP